MASVPIYPTGCIAPDTSSSGAAVLLVGVPANQDGRLEIYSVKLGDLSAPTATFVGNHTNEIDWSVRGPRLCLPYPGAPTSGNIPIMVQQFSPATSYFTNIYPNGTVEEAKYFEQLGFSSPKNYLLTGGAGTINWITALGNITSPITSSPWAGLLMSGSQNIGSTRDFLIGMYPTTTPLVSVGVYTLQADTPGPGYIVVFGSTDGTIYNVADSFNINLPSHLTTLSTPTPVSMNNITLTSNAFSQSAAGIGYIFDKASDGSTILYSISPSKSPKLQYVTVSGNVPPFSAAISSTMWGAKIVTYTSSTTAGIFNAFDVGAGTWSGPGLIKPSFTPPPTTPDPEPSTVGSSGGSKTPIGAIVGGVVGALVVIALAAFFVIRNRRRQRTKAAVANTGHQDEHKPDNQAAAPLMQQNYTLAQQQQQPPNDYQQQVPFNHAQPHQQFNPHYHQQPFKEQPQFIQPNTTSPAFVSQPVPLPVQQTSTPIIFQPQTKEPYIYTPPTFVPQTHVSAAVPGVAHGHGGLSPEHKTYVPPVGQNPHTSPGLPYTSLPSFTGAFSVTTSSPNSNNPQAIISPLGFQSDVSSPGNPQVIVQSSHNNYGYAQ
ncbi:hypothetical protein CPC16_009248 [Podila verticillata]|nr:hypothetical protein CPC16_009248 [Podila verticillata]